MPSKCFRIRESRILPEFRLRMRAERRHFIGVLPFDDEFCKDVRTAR
jgi:hypothetical protein